METLQKQFQIVKSETRTSHVMEYGDMVSSCLIFDGDKMIKLDVKKKLAAASGRRRWPICWCCLDRGPGSFDVEDATTLS